MIRNRTAVFLLILAVGAVFWQLPGNDFINFDDPRYVTENRQVQSGLTPDSVAWALTATEASNWHPLTWLSHMADVELFGLNPAGHHLSSLLFHTAAAVFLYLALSKMTGRRLRSLAVALLFGVHPLHVESVAWVAERKDVLSGLFFMLTLHLYARYVQQPSPFRYLACLIVYALGLTAKPMLVTLPFLLLLLDVWPLNRATRSFSGAGRIEHPGRLLLEKAPFFLLSAVSCTITFLVQKKGGAVAPLEFVPLADRIANAIHSYGAYLARMIWPSNLAVFYPYNRIEPLSAVSIAAALLAVTIGAAALRRRHPYLLVGWLWYLGMLVPVIGLVQVGNQAMADRYTYLPLIGPFVMMVWGGSELGKRLGLGWKKLAVSGSVVLAALMLVGWFQVRYWKNSIRLFTHAVAVTGPNAVAHSALGSAYGDAGNAQQAVLHFRKALELSPGNPFYHYGLGLALSQTADPAGAAKHLQTALGILEDRKDRQKVLVALGSAAAQLGRTAEAEADFRKALAIDPADARAHIGLGDLLAGQQKQAEAIVHYEAAAAAEPASVSIQAGLARLYVQVGDVPKALARYRDVLRLDPNQSEAHFVIGQQLLEQNDVFRAARHFQEGLRHSPQNARAHFFLGIALARQGRFSAAADSFFEAVRIDPEFAASFYNLGVVLDKLGRKTEAAAAFAAALRLNPDCKEAKIRSDRLGDAGPVDPANSEAIHRGQIDLQSATPLRSVTEAFQERSFP